jgi:hypothetical protein
MGDGRERVLMNQETRLLAMLACVLGAWLMGEVFEFLELLESEREFLAKVWDPDPPPEDVTAMMNEVRRIRDTGK